MSTVSSYPFARKQKAQMSFQTPALGSRFKGAFKQAFFCENKTILQNIQTLEMGLAHSYGGKKSQEACL